jgi:hypothetical protein
VSCFITFTSLASTGTERYGTDLEARSVQTRNFAPIQLPFKPNPTRRYE